jgi:hypothetical protein
MAATGGSKGFVKFSSKTTTLKVELVGGLSTSLEAKETVETSLDPGASLAASGEYHGSLYETLKSRRDASESAAQEREATRFRPKGLNEEDAAFLEEVAERQEAQLRSEEEQAAADRVEFEEARMRAAASRSHDEEERLRRAIPTVFARGAGGGAKRQREGEGAEALPEEGGGAASPPQQLQEPEQQGQVLAKPLATAHGAAAAPAGGGGVRPGKRLAGVFGQPLPAPPFACSKPSSQLAPWPPPALLPPPPQHPAAAPPPPHKSAVAALVDYSDSDPE